MATNRTGTHSNLHGTASVAQSVPALGRWILLAGPMLLLIAWGTAWFGPEPARWYTFLPLWVGYVVTVDAVTVRLTGASYLTTTPKLVLVMFVVSMPCWWLFEALNERLGNWTYRLPFEYSTIEYGVLASIAFSTVIPAILQTAALYRSLGIGASPRPGAPIAPLSERSLRWLIAAGFVMLALVLLVPGQAFPLAWLSLVFIVDPINALRGYPSLFIQASRGDWSRILPLSLAGLTCGFFWEMWNYWSTPSWEYDVPYVGFWPIFEMPVLGYGGYIPFAWELSALWTLAGSIFPAFAAHRRQGRFSSI